MELEEKLKKMKMRDLCELKGIIDSIGNYYAENLTDYALMSGDNSLNNIPKDKVSAYKKRKKYKDASIMIGKVLEKKVNDLLCLED